MNTEVVILLAITEYDPRIQDRTPGKQPSEEEIKQHNNTSINKLASLMTDFPDSKLLNISLMNACIANPENSNCSSANIDDAVKLDGNNGALLSKIAALYDKKSDSAAAYNFLESAANAPLFNDYRNERILQFINALRPSGLTLHDIVFAAIGLDASISTGELSNISAMCRSDFLTKKNIQTCLAYGKRLESDGNNLLLNYVGLNIQKMIFKAIDNKSSLAGVDKKRKALDQIRNEITFSEQFFYDENFINDWLTTISNYNEKDSLRYMKEEADRLMADPDYHPCPKE